VQQAPALPIVLERMPATIELAFYAMLLSVVLAVPVGVICAVRRGRLVDRLSMLVTLTGQSMPTFWLGIMMVLIFAVRLGVLPTSGRGTPAHLVLPVITLAAYYLAMIARLTRSGLLEVLGLDYIRTARAKGLPERVVIYHHALKNSLIPLVTMVGLQFGRLLGGAVITESVFEWPGVGKLIVLAINQRDYPVVQSAVFMLAMVFVAVNMLTDVLYGYLDPRIRLK
ncbi:MAG: ABC transporter permease, partial [Firmicutes bacterium]|nr:ABC transporter permease [Bacillota bacterium]